MVLILFYLIYNCSMFVSTAKRLRVLKSSELSTLKREPTLSHNYIFVLSVKLVFMARAFLDL